MQKTKLVSLILLLTLLLSSCAFAQEDNSPLPINPILSSTSPTPEAEWGLWEEATSAPAAHDCDLENYYTIDIVHEPEYDVSIVVYDIEGREIYSDSYGKGFHVKYVDNCILSVTYYTGTMNKVVHYVDIHNGREAQYDNPVLAGNGVVCVVVPNEDDTKLVYQIYSMFEPDQPILEDEFEAAMWSIPHSAIMNSSFWLENVIYLTYMLPDEKYEKTIQIRVPEVD